MASNEVLVGGEDLKAFTAEVFTRAGLAPEDAEIEADVLVWANLRGVDSHGVLRIPWYLSHVDNGVMKTRPNIQVVKETAATILIDADQAFGPVVTTMAMRRVVEKAKNVGIGWGFIRNTTHQGAMGYYALMAAKEDMAGIACVAGPPNMAPHGPALPVCRTVRSPSASRETAVALWCSTWQRALRPGERSGWRSTNGFPSRTTGRWTRTATRPLTPNWPRS